MLLVLLLSGSSAILAQKAFSDEPQVEDDIPPALIQGWKDYLKSYPQRLATYYKEQKERRQSAKKVVFSPDMSISAALKAYPFLAEDLNMAADIQNTIANEPPQPDRNYSLDTSVHVRIGEDRGKTANFLFVEKTGSLFCGTRGCSFTVYVDEGGGYKKVKDFILFEANVYVSRSGEQPSLFLAPPTNDKSVEWILRNHLLIINQPPTKDPISQAYVGWRHEMMLKGEDPEANIKGDEPQSPGTAPAASAPKTPPPDDTLAPPEQ